MSMSDPRDALATGLGALGGVVGVLFVLALIIAIWPLFAAFCLNVVAGFGLSFWQIVGIGWFAGLTASSS